MSDPQMYFDNNVRGEAKARREIGWNLMHSDIEAIVRDAWEVARGRA